MENEIKIQDVSHLEIEINIILQNIKNNNTQYDFNNEDDIINLFLRGK